MRKIIFLFLLYFTSISQSFIPTFAANIKDEWDQAEKSLFELMPQIPVLSDRYPNDLEMQLGIAALYYQYGAPLENTQKGSRELGQENNQKFVRQCEKVFTIDPNNKPATAILSMRICRIFTNTRTIAIDQLKRMIDNARGRNVNDISISPNNFLKKYFSEDDSCVIGKYPFESSGDYAFVISDFNLAINHLYEKIDENYPDVLSQMNKFQSKDFDNAYYNYLKAHLFFAIGEKEKALKEIEEGVLKKYFSSFQDELAISIGKVLQEAGMPQEHLNVLVSIRSPFEDFAIQAIWKRGLSDLGEENKINGNIKKAYNIYKLTFEMAKQIQKEQINKPLGLAKIAQSCIDGLSSIENSTQEEKIIAQNISPTKKPIGVALPIAGASFAVIVIAGLFFFLRKKNPNKAE